jgi:hypothetical protein
MADVPDDALLAPYGVSGRGGKLIVWAENEANAIEHADAWLEYVERSSFSPGEPITAERLGEVRTARELAALWETIPGEHAREAAANAGKRMKELLDLDARWRKGRLLAIRQGWS